MAEAIVVEWQSTPALWLAYRQGTCFCEDCRGKVPTGLGKTKIEAAADLEEKESEMAPNIHTGDRHGE